ncbi:carbohydrate ABC transporter substrate-binding protein (CUT1 family) [Arcticibacter pallidicorallinus]|uniref:Carbohydrate ABC transporter substrate-binding protein (CUT1 family) n=1 Tax=Arcticibacter pallidicorallinus TaxID=1259464 RepID=A0A2T0U3U4_9SPHI|nr:extracellular solute-binding protein [Arcticibacter pallidicorallinus]PRY52570.1 carbohydrate ABC transporter substrate-binding protein (CUT1 family) [Arcticibacter pallidicorallinus]
MPDTITLKGITWNHSRGLVPMVATAQRFSELYPGTEISWEKRSLQQFADFSIEELAKRFDLLVIDHPWAGFAAKKRSIIPLDEVLPDEFLKNQQQNSVGHSYESYTYDNHQWALPIDAATPVAASRPDLLEKADTKRPENFEQLLSLADKGLVAFAGIPIDVLMSFYMFCSSLGEDPCQEEDKIVSEAVGMRALQMFRELTSRIDVANFERNPIQVYEAMTQTDEIAYCPFAYGYSNYAREGYARKVLHFHDMISLDGKSNMRSTIGGTGLAISAHCAYIDVAAQYAHFVASEECQSKLYFSNGGQPGHLGAWQNAEANRQTNNYFADTLPALQRAFLRPRYYGHMYFQDHAGDIVRNYLMNGGEEKSVLEEMNKLYLKSRKLQMI